MTQGELKQLRTPEQQARDFLGTIPDEQLACMSQRHPWPVIDLKKKTVPKGISALPQHDGCWQIRETCPVCGKVRWYTTLKGGAFDTSVQYRYEDPPNWVVRHSEIEATRRDYKAELFRRVLGQSFGAELFRSAS